MTAQILIADHDPVVRELCRRYLAIQGYDVVVAADGLQCIEQLGSNCPDLLVLDPKLLWGGGQGVLAWLEEVQPAKPVKVVIANGHATEGLPDKICNATIARLDRPTGLVEMTEFVDDVEHILARDKEAIRYTPSRYRSAVIS